MFFGVSVGLMFILGILFSLAAWRHENLRENRIFRCVGTASFFAALALCTVGIHRMLGTASGFGEAFVVVILLAVGCIVWAWFGAYAISEELSLMARKAIGIENQRVPPPCSLAEAAVARREYKKAEELYREVIAEYPDEPKPCRDLAEMMLRTDRPTEAMHWFEQAERRESDMGIKMMDRFAAADVMSDRLGDIPGAIAMIERFMAEHPTEKTRDYGVQRIQALRCRFQSSSERPS